MTHLGVPTRAACLLGTADKQELQCERSEDGLSFPKQQLYCAPKLTLYGHAGYYFAFAIGLAGVILFTVYHKQIVAWLRPAADWMHK